MNATWRFRRTGVDAKNGCTGYITGSPHLVPRESDDTRCAAVLAITRA
jgi:hypothetical protein